jgi:hypothetical protein
MIRRNKIPGTIASVFSLVLLAGCASSPDTSPATAGYPSVEQMEGDPNRVVCQRQQETGSRMSKRVCKTAAEWEQERFDNQEAIRNATRSGMRPSDMPTVGGG